MGTDVHIFRCLVRAASLEGRNIVLSMEGRQQGKLPELCEAFFTRALHHSSFMKEELS